MLPRYIYICIHMYTIYIYINVYEQGAGPFFPNWVSDTGYETEG